MKVFKIFLISLISLLAAASVFVAGLFVYNYVRCAEFYLTGTEEGKIPGISDGFVPEGYCAAPDGGIISGYMTGGGARLDLIRESGEITYTDLVNGDGTPFLSRASGVEQYGKYVYVTGDDGLYMFYYEDLFEALSTAEYYGIIETYITPEWCEIYDERLYVGSNSKNAEAPEWQATDFYSEIYSDLIVVFRLDSSIKFGIKKTPICLIASPEGVEGAHVNYHGFALSRTVDSFESRLDFYTLEIGENTYKTVGEGEDEKTLIMYFLSSPSKTYSIKTPPMTQDMVAINGRLYFVGNSASQKNVWGSLLSLDRFYSIPIKESYYK